MYIRVEVLTVYMDLLNRPIVVHRCRTIDINTALKISYSYLANPYFQ